MPLMLWLKLDGDTNDSSGNGRNFTNNSVVFADAKIGQGYYNDSGNYARRAYRFDTGLHMQTNFTYSAWINSTGTTTGTHIFYQMALSNFRDCCGNIGYNIAVVNSSGNIVIGYGNTMLFTSVNARNKWVHVAVSVGTTQIKIYFNGVLTYTRTHETFVYSSSYPLTIGKMGFYYQGPDGYFAWEGFVDEVRIYNHALTANEVKKLAQAKVTHLKLSGNLNDAAGYVNGTGSISYTTDTIRNKQCRSSGTVTIANGSQAITGDQTIAMWLYPTNIGRRENPWNKAYGGEGTITQETDGSFNYYWGTNGGNSSPYQGFNSGQINSANTWIHIAIVRDLTNNILRWYKNGVQVATATPSYGASAKTTANTLVGSGYTSAYSGRIADVRQYATALSAAEILKLATVPIYFDADGNIFCHEYETVGVGNNVKFNSKGVIQANAFQEAQNMGSVKQKVDNFVLKMNGRILDL